MQEPGMLSARQSSHTARHQILQEFGGRGAPGDEHPVPRPRDRDVKEVTLGIVHLVEVRFVACPLDP